METSAIIGIAFIAVGFNILFFLACGIVAYIGCRYYRHLWRKRNE